MVVKRKSLPPGSQVPSSPPPSSPRQPSLTTGQQEPATSLSIPPVPLGLFDSLNQRHTKNPSAASPRDPDSDSDWDASDEERKELKKSGRLRARSSPKPILPQVELPQDNAYSGLDAFAASMAKNNSDAPVPKVPARSPKRASFGLAEAPASAADATGLESSAPVWDSAVPEPAPLPSPQAPRGRPPVPSSNSWMDTTSQFTPMTSSSTFTPEKPVQPVGLSQPVPSTVNSQNIWNEQPQQIESTVTSEELPKLPPRPPPMPKQETVDTKNPWAEAEANWASRRAAAEGSNSKAPAYTPQDESNLPISALPMDDVPSPGWAEEQGHLPEAASKTQRNEVYQVKHIRYGPAASTESYRSWPVLIQNANGPCPLLALVNALVLSTPAESITGLIETLRVREQVSLELLLDAVVDELMSRGSGVTGSALPDIGDLYAFLVNLHTGMNVNPLFVAKQDCAGGFEETREMRLYGTFRIPLIHGWLPDQQSEAHMAFERSALSFEDAQNLLLKEEWLHSRLDDASIDEQTQYMDITPIKTFLEEWPSQLTPVGLETMQRTMQTGSFAILFRNDHFSTIYKEPRSRQLMSLVTDAGYLTHDEIIWENLVDVSGVQSEYFSGDFRSVSHSDNAQATQDDGQEWTTVESKNPRRKVEANVGGVSGSGVSSLPPGFSALSLDTTDAESVALMKRLAAEQEQADRDFAMALQLQEEEEERDRTNLAARERENQLSEQFVASEANRNSSQAPPPQPPRPGAAPPSRRPPAQVTTRSTADDESAPPPYEQATASPPYSPSIGTPRAQLRTQTSPFLPQGSTFTQAPTGRRRLSSRQSYLGDRAPGSPQTPRGSVSTVPGGNSTKEEEEKCVIM